MNSTTYYLKYVSDEFKTDAQILSDHLLNNGIRQESLGILDRINEEEYHLLESYYAFDLAVRRLKECIQSKSAYLDIGNCNLKDDDFSEGTGIYTLFQDCSHLETISFSSEWIDYDSGNLIESVNKQNCNFFSRVPAVLIFLRKLKKLILSGPSKSSKNPWTIQDSLPVEFLRDLRYLDLSRNEFNLIAGLSTLTQIEVLDISQNNLLSTFNLNNIRDLKILKLSQNQISEIGSLEHSYQLYELDLSINKIDEIKGLEHLSSLRKLELYDNQIKEIKGLQNLSELRILHLSGNKITTINGLDKLVKLKELDLSENRLIEIDGLSNLKNLTDLNISGNNLQSLKGLSELNNLKTITSVDNKITDMNGIESLQNLKDLFLSSNQIYDISAVKFLGNLKSIYLRNNQIEELSQFEFILDFDDDFYIEVDNNPFLIKYHLKPNSYQNHYPFIKELLIRQKSDKKENFIYPIKVLMLGNHAVGKSSIVNYITNSNKKGSTHILRIEDYRLSIGDNKTNTPDVIFFDFGGQDFYHGLYQAFISPGSFQVIVFAHHKDCNQHAKDIEGYDIRNYDRYYWLGQKRYSELKTGISDPFIMVQTYADQTDIECRPIDFSNQQDYKRSFFLSFPNKNVVEQQAADKFHSIGREYFKVYFENSIAEILKENTRQEPQWYIDFLNSILNNKRPDANPIRITTLLENYNIENLSLEDRYDSLVINLENLHNHGLILYYYNDELKDFLWPDPEAFVKYVQENVLAIDNFKSEKPGIVKQIDFENKVNEPIRILLQLQKVIFLHKPSKSDSMLNEYIIPNYLPLCKRNEPDYQLYTFGLGAPNFVLKFNDFIPFGLINQMISFFGREFNAKKFWRDQLLFTLNNEARVLIQLDFEQQRIAVYFQLLNNSRGSEFEVSEYLFFNILALYWNFEDDRLFAFDEYLTYKSLNKIPSEIKGDYEDPLIHKIDAWEALHKDDSCYPYDAYVSVDNKRYIAYAELMYKSEEDYKIKSYTLTDSGRINDRDVKEISISQFAFIKNVVSMKNLFISYSHVDTQYLQQLRKFLINLERDGIINIWQDGLIQAGDDWDDKIKESLDKADICIMLLSQEFISSTYVHEVEFRKILERKKTANCRIIPVLISNCDWRNWKVYPKDVVEKLNDKDQKNYSIASFQFLPKSDANSLVPVNRLEHKEDA